MPASSSANMETGFSPPCTQPMKRGCVLLVKYGCIVKVEQHDHRVSLPSRRTTLHAILPGERRVDCFRCSAMAGQGNLKSLPHLGRHWLPDGLRWEADKNTLRKEDEKSGSTASHFSKMGDLYTVHVPGATGWGFENLQYQQGGQSCHPSSDGPA